VKRRQAFTLIELLVVVAIIAVLIAILLPSLGKAREQAKRSACLANMHAMSNALAVYASSNSDVLPPQAIGFNKNNGTINPSTMVSGTFNFTPNLWRYHNNNGLILLNTTSIMPTIKAFYCPANTWAPYRSAFGTTYLRSDGQIQLPVSSPSDTGGYFGYAFQFHSNTNPVGAQSLVSLPGGTLIQPAYKKFAAFPNPNVALGGDIMYNSSVLPHGKNGNIINIWFNDGHAASLTGSSWQTGTVGSSDWNPVFKWVNEMEVR
jgi:prepilin-type N-terminal cleavage/methylation domain-containing protein